MGNPERPEVAQEYGRWYYNRVRRHSSLGDRPPMAIIQDFYDEG